jgi:RNA polymerase sigma factor (sigma-70 family)
MKANKEKLFVKKKRKNSLPKSTLFTKVFIPSNSFEEKLAKDHLLDELNKIVICETFADHKTHANYLGPLPDLEGFKKEQAKSHSFRTADMPPEISVLYGNPILTREQERHCFRKYNLLKYKALKSLNCFGAAGERTVIKNLTAAVEMKKFLGQSNVRLAVHLATKQYKRATIPDLWKMVSEANQAIMRCIAPFDYNSGNKFATYATWAINRNLWGQLNDDKKDEKAIVNNLELDYFDHHPCGDSNEENLDHNQQMIAKILKEVGIRERKIIEMYYFHDMTLAKIAGVLKISKERVRQIREKCFVKINDKFAGTLIF